MNISKDKVVSVSYSLRVNAADGEVVETVSKDKPMSFLFGNGHMIPKFEENLNGLGKGDNFKFDIESAEAYGNASDDAIVDLPKNIFEVEGKIQDDLLFVNNVIPMQDQNGNILNGLVLEVGNESVKMDFNHPLAGDDLYFEGEVVGVREATPEEIEHGHVHDGSEDH